MKQPQPPYSNLWEKLASEPLPVKVVDFPRYDQKGQAKVQVALRCLSHQDVIKIQSLAQAETDRMFKEEGHNLSRDNFRLSQMYVDRYKNIAAKHYLMGACRVPENHALPFFPTPDDIAKHCKLDEVTVLVEQHKQFELECGPIISLMSSEKEMQEWIERLVAAGKENAST